MATSIPGSFVDRSVAGIDWRELPSPSREQKAYGATVADGVLFALVSQDQTTAGKLWHVSVSFRDRDGSYSRCPTWDELKHAKFHLVPADIAMVLIFPRKNVPYVNVHSTTLHLWESTDKNIDVN